MNKAITISVSEEDIEKFKKFSKAKDMCLSAVYRRGALELISREAK